jgi:hypothetical protein
MRVCNNCATKPVCKYRFQNTCDEWKPDADQRNIAKMVRDIYRVDHGLTDWEIAFLDEVGLRTDFSDKQADKITQIYRRVC